MDNNTILEELDSIKAVCSMLLNDVDRLRQKLRPVSTGGNQTNAIITTDEAFAIRNKRKRKFFKSSQHVPSN